MKRPIRPSKHPSNWGISFDLAALYYDAGRPVVYNVGMLLAPSPPPQSFTRHARPRAGSGNCSPRVVTRSCNATTHRCRRNSVRCHAQRRVNCEDLRQRYLCARFYDPSNGRFNRLDPFAGNFEDPLSLHKYLYGHADPVNATDPTGEFALFAALDLIGIYYEGVRAGFNALNEGRDALAGFYGGVIDATLYSAAFGLLGAAFFDDVARAFRFLAPRLITQKLSQHATRTFRAQARVIWEATTGRRAIWDGLEVHHRVPLEWSHLFGRADPNRLSNLVGITNARHVEVTNAWGAWKRQLGGRNPTQTEVLQQALRVDEEFAAHWVFPNE